MTTTQELIERLRSADPYDMPMTTADIMDDAASRLASLSAELDALRGKLAGVDEKALEAGYTRLQQYADFPLEFPPDETFRAAIAAYLAAGG